MFDDKDEECLGRQPRMPSPNCTCQRPRMTQTCPLTGRLPQRFVVFAPDSGFTAVILPLGSTKPHKASFVWLLCWACGYLFYIMCLHL